MERKGASGSEKLKLLEYILEDYLELKASLRREQTKPLKEFLFSQPLDGQPVSPVEGFLLANHLVVLEARHPNSVEHLVFLKPQDGSIRVRSLG